MKENKREQEGLKTNLYGNPTATDSETVSEEYKALIGKSREDFF